MLDDVGHVDEIIVQPPGNDLGLAVAQVLDQVADADIVGK